MMEDLNVFFLIAGMIAAGFCFCFLGIMPTLGDSGPYAIDGALFLPFWAMYGEFGDLPAIGTHGHGIGPVVVWLYTFVAQASVAFGRHPPPSLVVVVAVVAILRPPYFGTSSSSTFSSRVHVT